MKRIIQLSILVFVLALAFQNDAQAQRTRSDAADKYFDESGNFASRLWYGGGFTLGFSGSNFESIFQLGISPMVGYKITNDFSVGPRFALTYVHYRVDIGINGTQAANFFDYGLGAFARYKVFRSFFAHAEYGFDNEVTNITYDQINDELNTSRRLRNNALLGAGYNDGNGVWGYEIALLYNLLHDDNDISLPFDFRFGLTYHF
jgi:hypothetical protein